MVAFVMIILYFITTLRDESIVFQEETIRSSLESMRYVLLRNLRFSITSIRNLLAHPFLSISPQKGELFFKNGKRERGKNAYCPRKKIQVERGMKEKNHKRKGEARFHAGARKTI